MPTTTSLRTSGLLAAALLAGCAEGTTIASRDHPGGTTLIISADVRTITHTRVGEPGDYIVCAEPSPDVAKAVETAFDLGGSLGVSGLPSNVEPKVALAIATARAESLAQLGERLATIQLLRDGLYRACEAYANGAITKTAYAVMLSRYDDTMVTMLLGEIAGGAFGRSLAGLGGEAGGNSAAAIEATRKLSEVTQAEASLRSASERRDEAQAALEEARASGEAARITQAETEFDSSETAEREAQRELAAKLNAAAEASAKAAATAAGAIAVGGQNAQIAQTLMTMQRKYLENLNADALEVACITAMDEAKGEDELSVFGRFCQGDMLPTLQREKTRLLIAVLERAWAEKDEQSKRLTFAEFANAWRAYVGEMDELRRAVVDDATAVSGD